MPLSSSPFDLRDPLRRVWLGGRRPTCRRSRPSSPSARAHHMLRAARSESRRAGRSDRSTRPEYRDRRRSRSRSRQPPSEDRGAIDQPVEPALERVSSAITVEFAQPATRSLPGAEDEHRPHHVEERIASLPTMCCLVPPAGFIGPRFALLLWWIFGDKVDAGVLEAVIWPLARSAVPAVDDPRLRPRLGRPLDAVSRVLAAALDVRSGQRVAGQRATRIEHVAACTCRLSQ